MIITGRRVTAAFAVLGTAASLYMMRSGLSARHRTAEVIAGMPTSMIAGPGRVEGLTEEIDVSAEVSGRLEAVLVDEGDHVTAGQPIAQLDAADYEARLKASKARLWGAIAARDRLVNGARPEERRESAAVAEQALAELEHARSERDRAQKLYQAGVIARNELDLAERDWRVAEARRVEMVERAATVDADPRTDERARADALIASSRAAVEEAAALLDKMIVRAPIAGVILRRHKQAGETVSVNTGSSAIVTMADASVLRVRVEVDEKDVAGLAVGQPAWVTARAFGDRRFGGRVVRVGQMLGRKSIRTEDPAEHVDTKVLETMVELDRDVRLPIGLRVDAFIQRLPSRRR
jgi:ABC exporter DevB family membrane fusion protein